MHRHQLEVIGVHQALLQVEHLLGIEERVFAPRNEVPQEFFGERRIARETHGAEFVARAALPFEVDRGGLLFGLHRDAALRVYFASRKPAPRSVVSMTDLLAS